MDVFAQAVLQICNLRSLVVHSDPDYNREQDQTTLLGEVTMQTYFVSDDAPGDDCPDHGPYADDDCPKC